MVGLPSYRREFLLIALVALATLSVVNLAGPQDRTRYELTRHLVLRHSLVLEPGLFDRAVYHGKTFSDKAPGMSFAAVPAYVVERVLGVARAPADWSLEGDLSLWGIRVATSGVLFLALVLLVGRAGEALVAGAGGITAVVLGTATVAAPLAPTFFEHDAAAFFAFVGFLFAWRGGERRGTLVPAGLALGIATLFQYDAAIVGAAVVVYAAVGVRRRVGWLLLGAVPPAVARGAYDWAAFGAPFHLSYRYVANRYAGQQRGGFFGIGVPSLTDLRDTLFADRGLFLLSPVLLAAVAGLWLMARRGYRREAFLAGFVTLVFVWLDAGYFLPYGGNSPGPRFLVPALPFLALGIPYALARACRLTLALAAVSAVLTAGDGLTWSIRAEGDRWYPGHGISDLAKTVWAWLGAGRLTGAAAVVVCSLLAVAVGAANARARMRA